MKYRITHTTHYHYESPVRVCQNLVLLSPREDSYLKTVAHRLQIRPTPQITNKRRDFFGNHLYAFTIEESHKQLVVTASSRVVVMERPAIAVAETPSWEFLVRALSERNDPQWLEASVFSFPSRRIQPATELTDYAKPSFAAHSPVLSAVLDLTARIHRDFSYDTTATAVHTKTLDAFRLRRGVCQDFAHIQIACLRAMNLPARYVSGYLRTIPQPGKARLVGADQSHAWVSVYCGTELGWVDVDPTNNCICQQDHIPIAWGRDFQDVVPIRGVFLGGGNHTLHVNVDVLPVM